MRPNNAYTDHNKEAEEELMDRVSTLIRERRQDLGISQEQLELMAFGVNSKSKWVCRVENGGRKGMNIKSLSKIFHVLKIDIIFKPQKI